MRKMVGILCLRLAVLIETYWNVNITPERSSPVRAEVLIETYWNVNLDRLHGVFCDFGSLNRNILECKCRRRGHWSYVSIRLNRNILECK